MMVSLCGLQRPRSPEEHDGRHQRCQEDLRGRLQTGQTLQDDRRAGKTVHSITLHIDTLHITLQTVHITGSYQTLQTGQTLQDDRRAGKTVHSITLHIVYIDTLHITLQTVGITIQFHITGSYQTLQTCF